MLVDVMSEKWRILTDKAETVTLAVSLRRRSRRLSHQFAISEFYINQVADTRSYYSIKNGAVSPHISSPGSGLF
jgi:hypothetical protein